MIQLHTRQSVVFFPVPILFMVTVGLGVLLATYLLPSEHWGPMQEITGVLILASMIDCIFRARICTYRAPDIICRSWNMWYRAKASDAWIRVERNSWTKFIQILWVIHDLFPPYNGGIGGRAWRWEPWELFIHVSGKPFRVGLIGGGDAKNALIPITNILHLSVKDMPLSVTETEQKIYDRLKVFDYCVYAAIYIVGIPLLIYLLLTAQH